MKRCVYKVSSQMPYGADFVHACGNPATKVDTNGRDLCEKHYNRWNKKPKL